jgi:acetylornithine deacetylase
MEHNSVIKDFPPTLLQSKAIHLLQALIALPSISGEEEKTADCIAHFLVTHNVQVFRHGNNVWALNRHYNSQLPTLLLNSHHDTVKPNPAYSRDPFEPAIENGKLYGLGSNDAGASLVSLALTFLHFYEKPNLSFNIIYAATAEEETSGTNGLESVLPKLGPISFALVGEPTCMQLAIAEKGLLVLDCIAYGKAGHAAREEGENALYKAIRDIEWFQNYQFPLVSEYLGPIKMTVTQIQAGSQHNVVPATCSYTVDIRLTEQYTHEEVMATIRSHVASDLHLAFRLITHLFSRAFSWVKRRTVHPPPPTRH